MQSVQNSEQTPVHTSSGPDVVLLQIHGSSEKGGDPAEEEESAGCIVVLVLRLVLLQREVGRDRPESETVPPLGDEQPAPEEQCGSETFYHEVTQSSCREGFSRGKSGHYSTFMICFKEGVSS